MTFDERRAFVIAWQAALTIDEFCERTGFDSRKASNNAGDMRKAGIPLKRMPRDYTTKHSPKMTPAEIRELCRLIGASAPLKVLADEEREQAERTQEHEKNAAAMRKRYQQWKAIQK